MKYPMRCPECKLEIESLDVPIEMGPPSMLCIACALLDSKLVSMRRVFSAVPAVFRGSGWGKS